MPGRLGVQQYLLLLLLLLLHAECVILRQTPWYRLAATRSATVNGPPLNPARAVINHHHRHHQKDSRMSFSSSNNHREKQQVVRAI
jgi:hypothetical protein